MKKRMRNIIEKISNDIDLPLNEVIYDDSICMSGRREICIYGVKNICLYEENKIILKLICDEMTLEGCKLSIDIFKKGGVRITGKINSVYFGG